MKRCSLFSGRVVQALTVQWQGGALRLGVRAALLVSTLSFGVIHPGQHNCW